MTEEVNIFCRQIRSRSAEHGAAIALLEGSSLVSVMVSILRQELDSMIRVIYLLSLQDLEERRRLIHASVSGVRWTHSGSRSPVTDAEMVRTSNRLRGWTSSVYRFGCSFVHLSAFHDYSDRDPLQSLPEEEKQQLLKHLRQYHGGPSSPNPSFDEVVPFLPQVFVKIASNLECYLHMLEAGEPLND